MPLKPNLPSQVDVLQLRGLGDEAQQLGHAVEGRGLHDADLEQGDRCVLHP